MKKKKKKSGGGKKNKLMKGRVTHFVMKRALDSFFKLYPFSRGTSDTRTESHTHNDSAHFTYSWEQGINEWSDRHRELMDPLPWEGNALIRTDLKTTTPPLCLLAFYSPSPSSPSSFPPSLFTPTLNLLLASLLASSRLTTPVYFRLPLLIHLHFFFVCVIILCRFVVCSCSL